MKFLVDKLPESPNECHFHKVQIVEDYITFTRNEDPTVTTYNNCMLLTNSIGFECKVGEKDFVCPFLREFKAKSVEQFKHLGTNSYKIIPVELE